MKKKSKYSNEVIQKVADLAQTHTDREIGQQLGLTKAQIYSLRRSNGINRSSTFKTDLLQEGFDGDNWSHGWLKTDNASIFIRNEEGIVSYEDVRDEMVAEMKKYAPKYPTIKRKKIKEGHMLVIDPADIHIGKLSMMKETGEEYNIEIAKQRCIDGVNGILEKAQGFPIDKIVFVIGNDVLHIDSPHRKTTAGTPQDTDGMWWSAFKEAKDMYIRVIEQLVTVADVEVVYCPSNHDYQSGFMLADTLSSWFHKSHNIIFSVDIIHRKYLLYGNTLIGFDHGDGSKEKDAESLIAHEARELWSKAKFTYFYKHHIHHKRVLKWRSGEDFIGLTVEYLRSPGASDGWHHRNGYIAPKAVEGFIHSKEHGQCARITHYF